MECTCNNELHFFVKISNMWTADMGLKNADNHGFLLSVMQFQQQITDL